MLFDAKDFAEAIDLTQLSRALTGMLNDDKTENNRNGEDNTSLDIEVGVLRKVLQWMDHYKDNPPPSIQKQGRDTYVMPKWDKEFWNVQSDELPQYMEAGYFLKIPGLVDAAITVFANHIKGKSTEQLRAMFNIKNDFTPEEEEAIKKEDAKIAEILRMTRQLRD